MQSNMNDQKTTRVVSKLPAAIIYLPEKTKAGIKLMTQFVNHSRRLLQLVHATAESISYKDRDPG